MADITMCKGDDCPKRDNCYRFTAKESSFLQSYFISSPIEEDGNCNQYWPVNHDKDDKRTIYKSPKE
jgi:hypothetical protein